MAANKDGRALEPLRILVADGKGQRLEEVTRTVTGLGHDLVGQASLGDIAPLTASLRPDAAIVIVGESSEHALDLIGKIVTEAACPVIAILDVEDEAFINRAAKRGIFAYITKERDGAALQSSLDVVLSRFAEYHGLEGAFYRRAITEQAKGILMERHSVDDQRAFEMLRDEARRSNRKLIEIARPSPSASTCSPSRLLSRGSVREIDSPTARLLQLPRARTGLEGCDRRDKAIAWRPRRLGDPRRCPPSRDSRRRRRTIGPPRRRLPPTSSEASPG